MEFPVNSDATSTTDNSKRFCSTFSQCLYLWIFYGLRYDSGISAVLESSDYTKYTSENMGLYTQRLFLDVGFHMLIKSLWLTFIMAIGIFAYFDFFYSEEEKVIDTYGKCFICHLDRDLFLKYKLNFDKHIRHEHNTLSYIYFIMYLVTKNPEKLTKSEEHILNKFRIFDFSWIPSQDTQILQNQIQQIREGKVFITSEYK
jgi:hypothetical protein